MRFETLALSSSQRLNRDLMRGEFLFFAQLYRRKAGNKSRLSLLVTRRKENSRNHIESPLNLRFLKGFVEALFKARFSLI